MKPLPNSETYEREMTYWPWGKLINRVGHCVVRNAAKNASVLDLMCGPGYLLGKILQRRQDFSLTGVDIDKDFIDYGKSNYPRINFVREDVLTWKTDQRRDVVLCTGGLHHIPYKQQEGLVRKVAEIVKPEGFCIFGDPCIRDYANEKERKIAAAELGYQSLVAVIKNGGDEEMIRTALDVMHNDIFRDEFKTSPYMLEEMYSRHFGNVEVHQTWPDKPSCYGDHYFVLKEPKLKE